MNIKIGAKGLKLSATLIEYVHQRVKRRLGRLGQKAKHIAVKISDINGPRGGVDMRCQVVMHVPGQPLLVTATTRDDLYAAVDHSLLRARERLARNYDKRIARRTKTPTLET